MIQENDLIDQANSGTLHRLILDNYERGNDADDAAFVTLAVDLHNNGTLDLLSALVPEALEEAKGFHFFTLQQFYCSAIPRLDVEPKPLMSAVSALVTAGGNDGMATAPNAAYRDWCAVKAERPVAALALIEAGDPEAKDYLSLSLEAGAKLDLRAYMERSIAYVRDMPEFRFGALTALSRFESVPAIDLARAALTQIAELARTETDDLVRTHILAATVGLYAQSPTMLHKKALGLMSKSVELRGEHVLHHAAAVLFSHRQHLSDEMIEVLLSALEEVKPSNLGTINSLDVGLSQLVKSGQGQRVSEFLEGIFQAHPDALSFKQFDSVGYALMSSERVLAEDMAVRWLMCGNQDLASAISSLLQGSTQNPTLFEVDIAPYSLSDNEALFLARKAVGWFFFHPITAASLIICILRSVKGAMAETIGDLLFEPLLLNYSGELREHLSARIKGPKDRAKPHIRRAVAKLDAYLDDLRAIGFVEELEPSESERLIERKQQSEQIRQIQKLAEQSSVLLPLISKSIVLHGNGSIGYRRGADGKLQRHAMKMGGFSTSWEAPRLQAIDPFGVEMQLRQFRSERLAA
ncbi:MAG: hypothetical protein HC788_02165 [Sphingopyxis sp.]|nr:hypothetical protein [Sphingopyxis sp.]